MGNFDVEIFTRSNAYIWISFIPRVPFDADCQRMQHVIEKRFSSNMMVELKKIMSTQQAHMTIEESSMIINNYWLRLGTEKTDATVLRASAQKQIDRLLSELDV